jgi:IclR family acetate operon transcriptional repressor
VVHLANRRYLDANAPMRVSLVSSVDRALSILDAFSVQREEIGLSELAKIVGLPKATTYRLAATLERHHYLRRDPVSTRYRLGLRVVALGGLALSHLGLGDHILPHMQGLAQLCGESVILAILDRGEVTYVRRVRSASPLAMDLPVGLRSPAHATALGKAMLAYLPEAEVESIIASRELVRLTARTITDPVALRAQLAAIRELGYAVDDGEFGEGVRCVAVPIFDRRKSVIAGLAVSGPSFRLTDEKLAQARDQLLCTASQVSSMLGYRGDDW